MKRFKIVVVVLGSLLLAIMLLNGCIKPETTSHPPIPTESAITRPAPPPTATEPEIVTFPDKNLEAVIRETLGKPMGEEILSGNLILLPE